MRGTRICLLSLALLSSCASGLPKVNAISASRIDKVLAEIKRQLSVYQATIARLERNPKEDTDLIAARAAGFHCGKGLINFEITSIDAELTTTNSSALGGSVAATLPVSAGTIAPGVSGSHAIEDTQTLKFSIFPKQVAPDFSYDGEAPIADLLTKLRRGFLKTATVPGACYYTYNPKDPKGGEGNTYEVGLTVTDVGGGEVSIALAPVEATLSGSATSVTGNTLTVHFAQRFDQRDPHSGGGEGIIAP